MTAADASHEFATKGDLHLGGMTAAIAAAVTAN